MYDHAVIIGASGGIGAALCAHVNARRVTKLSRSADGFDITDEASVAAGAERVDAFDLLIDATGALSIEGGMPEKAFRQISPEAMAQQFAVNAIGPALILKHFMKRLPRDRRGVIATLSARVGSIEDNRLGGWVSYRAAKAALNQIVRTAAIELARTHPHALCLALHPGTVATQFTEAYAKGYDRVPPADAAQNLLNVIEQLDAHASGGFYDWRGDAVPW